VIANAATTAWRSRRRGGLVEILSGCERMRCRRPSFEGQVCRN
jgi:hypothetical protein